MWTAWREPLAAWQSPEGPRDALGLGGCHQQGSLSSLESSYRQVKAKFNFQKRSNKKAVGVDIDYYCPESHCFHRAAMGAAAFGEVSRVEGVWAWGVL